ncbi:MAG: anti-sigma factor family protein [Nitrospiria bacterium]
MKCREFQERLTSYLDIELTLEERQTVKDHLAVCSICAKELNGLKKVGQWVHLTQVEPDVYFQKQVLKAVRSKRTIEKPGFWKKSGRSFFYAPVFKRAAMAFVFLLAVSSAYYLGYQSRPLSPENSRDISQNDLETINQEIDFYKDYEVIHQLELLQKMNQQKEEEQKL